MDVRRDPVQIPFDKIDVPEVLLYVEEHLL